MKQKRQSGAGGMVQASNISTTQLTSHTMKWINPNKELHGKIDIYNNSKYYFNIIHFHVDLNFYRIRWAITIHYVPNESRYWNIF